MTTFEACWQKELAKSYTDPEKLLSYLDISNEGLKSGFSARKLFPLRAPRPFVARMKKGDVNDPLLKQVITDSDEFKQVLGFSPDPLQEHEAVLPGLLHKYKSRVLMLVKTGCAINCRYCFRRYFPYQENSLNKSQWPSIIDYISQHPEVNEIVLSGGDPLMANDDYLHQLFELLEGISHLKRIRIHTRLPVVIPNRITPKLSKLLRSSRFKIIVVLHINHENEIDEGFALALQAWRERNITLLNQAVLLKGVNDTLTAQVNLSERLFEVGILPYYLHMLDKVEGAAHFEMEQGLAANLYQQMLAELPGFLMPKWVREEGGKASKSPIIPTLKLE